ncbi:MAG: hypothetical protein KGI68_14170 [Alphaproteobacteria bacterium]|nr:hypothetical protein [Alphaproteobacteria bacterium]MDE1940164.1 hypothetical protein [Alphaproteobacteria bacterium]MDE2012431.1 hypothetical protein [Alphaproteobacteria bacterium]MDE2072069.1 hypothetical protein [Alphaproteobacteria bacterium]MDE2352363.1 hypothetical protein [Alphaproteobacteria bacterium]
MITRSFLTGVALLSLAAVPAFAAGQTSIPASTPAKPVAAMSAAAQPATKDAGAKASVTSAKKVAGKAVHRKHRVASHKLHRKHEMAMKVTKAGTKQAKADKPVTKTAKAGK